MAASVQRFPEAVDGLRRLLYGVVPAVRNVLFRYPLQRSGCALCGIGPHSTAACPRMDRQTAEQQEAALFRRWMVVIGQELLLYGATERFSDYAVGAAARVAEHSQTHRPPRFQSRQAGAGSSQPSGPAARGSGPARSQVGAGAAGRGRSGGGRGSASGAGGGRVAQHVAGGARERASGNGGTATDDGLLPTPPGPGLVVQRLGAGRGGRAARRRGRQEAPAPQAPSSPLVAPPTEDTHMADAGASAAGAPAGLGPAHEPPSANSQVAGLPDRPQREPNAAHPAASPREGALPRGPPRVAAPWPPAGPRLATAPRTPPRQAASSAAEVADVVQFESEDGELVEIVLPPESAWFEDSTSLDALAPFARADAPPTVGQMVLDDVLAQRICGLRRERDFPLSTPPPNKARLHESLGATKFYVPRRLIMGDAAVGAPTASSSSDAPPEEATAQQPASQIDFEQWTDVTYCHAPRKDMRARFWQNASVAAKARMTAHLQSLPPTTARVVQAREMGWIPPM